MVMYTMVKERYSDVVFSKFSFSKKCVLFILEAEICGRSHVYEKGS